MVWQVSNVDFAIHMLTTNSYFGGFRKSIDDRNRETIFAISLAVTRCNCSDKNADSTSKGIQLSKNSTNTLRVTRWQLSELTRGRESRNYLTEITLSWFCIYIVRW